MSNTIAHCRDMVRKADIDGYVATLMLPQRAQAPMMAVRALNVEVARVRESVRDINIGRIRMRFWKDVVEAAYSGKANSGHPVAEALTGAIGPLKMSKKYLMRLIQERDDRLGEPPFYTTKDLEKYGENTQSTLLYVTLHAMGISDVHADHAVSHIGKALGVVTQLRALPFHLSQRRLMIPLDIAAKHNLDEEQIARGNLPPEWMDAVYDMAVLGNDHLLTARHLKANVPKSALPALLPAIVAEDFLTRLEKAEFDVTNGYLHRRNGMLPFKLWMSKLRGQY